MKAKSQASAHVRTVHLVFKTHLDVGYTDLAANVLRRYIEQYIPAAMALSKRLREEEATQRFIWTTGSWLVHEFLERADHSGVRQMEQAIEAGDFVWHAMPFTTHTELMDASMFRFALSLSRTLDRRFGKRTIAAKMTDVPGHTRAIVPLLAEAGVRLLHIGVNAACAMPAVPRLFRWQSGGAEVIMVYDGGYGSNIVLPGCPDALAWAFTGDNCGPQAREYVAIAFNQYRNRFPGALVKASTMDAFAARLWPIRRTLPVVTQEIGDTWIHGLGTDPLKVARFRELQRLRRQWLEEGRIDEDDRAFQRFSRTLLPVAEHTWGMDEKVYLDDYKLYDTAGLKRLRRTTRCKIFESSWQEQRSYIDQAVAHLPAPLARQAQRQLAQLRPVRADTKGLTPLKPGQVVRTPQVELTLDAKSSQIVLRAGRSTVTVFPSYQTFSEADYERYLHQYVRDLEKHRSWIMPDLSKPGIDAAGAKSDLYRAALKRCWQRTDDDGITVISNWTLPAEARKRYGAPAEIQAVFHLAEDSGKVDLDLSWFGKKACRMPEATWLSFQTSIGPAQRWTLRKMGREIDPRDVVENGNRALHGIDDAAICRAGKRTFVLRSLDAPLVAPGTPSLLDFPNRQPSTQAVHFCLQTNVWGTNFPMWLEDDMRYRFILDMPA